MSEGFIKTCIDMRRRSFDINYSGSTVVTVMLSGNKLICANVGDSRAVLGSTRSKRDAEMIEEANKNDKSGMKFESVGRPVQGDPNKVWIATALSRDHKPDLPDEFERIMACNGRVDPFREPNGDPIGPHRVWLRNENVPGLAMSRSLGDLVASSVGVIPEPEFFEIELNEDDKILLLASDGIWEFIQNEDAINQILPYYYKNDPDGACEQLVRDAVAHWKREDEVIDDITIICIFLKVPPQQK